MNTTMNTTNHKGIEITTREYTDGYEHRITVLVPTKWDENELEPMGWITKFGDDRKWNLVYKGENNGKSSRKAGMEWLLDAAHRHIVSL